MQTNMLFDDADVISVYTRAQAIEDGVLVDTSPLALEAGIRFPVALTAELNGKLYPPKGSHESYTGRLWDVLFLLRMAAKQGGEQIRYTVKIGRENVAVKAICGPGDEGEPVITLMLPWED